MESDANRHRSHRWLASVGCGVDRVRCPVQRVERTTATTCPGGGPVTASYQLALGVRRHLSTVRMRSLVTLLAIVVFAACARDQTITRGAEGSHEWQRRLAAAVPLGTSPDSARASLETNGFRCPPAQSRDTLWCDKWSGGRFAIVRRRWQAVVRFDGGGVADVRGTTGMVGP